MSTRFPQRWVSLPAMRWEKLFADLEGAADDDALAERDALVNDLRDGERAETSWQQLTGGQVVLDVVGFGRIEGEVLSGNARLIHLRSQQAHLLVNPACVMAVLSSAQHAGTNSVVSAKLGWPTMFRLLQRDQDRVQVVRSDANSMSGTVDFVGADFVRIRDEAGKTPMIPFAAIAAVSCQR